MANIKNIDNLQAYYLFRGISKENGALFATGYHGIYKRK